MKKNNHGFEGFTRLTGLYYRYNPGGNAGIFFDRGLEGSTGFAGLGGFEAETSCVKVEACVQRVARSAQRLSLTLS
jgi:hypothetical protein